MTTIVIDASVTASLLFDDEAGDRVEQVEYALREGLCLAPALWQFEVANLLWKALRTERITAEQLDRNRLLLDKLDVTIEDIVPERAWGTALDLACRHGLTVYDASYLELARRKSATLATHDIQLRAAALAEFVELLPKQ